MIDYLKSFDPENRPRFQEIMKHINDEPHDAIRLARLGLKGIQFDLDLDDSEAHFVNVLVQKLSKR